MTGDRSDYRQSRLSDDVEWKSGDAAPPQKGSFLSRLNNPILFFILSMAACNLSIAGSGYRSATITTIERRFRLRSQQSAIIPIIADAVGVSTMIFVVHFGASRHRPRVMSSVLMLSGLGFILFAVPHLFYPMPSFLREHTDANMTMSSYSTGGRDEDVCSLSEEVDVETCSDDQLEESGALLGQVLWLFVGAALTGLNTSFYPLFITHIDDGVSKKYLSVYLGGMYAVFMLGMLIAFLLASVCLQIPAYLTDPDFRELTPYDSQFLGAWWLGFLIVGVLQIIFALPIFFFPRYLRKPKEELEAVDDDGMGDIMIKVAKFELNTDEGETFLVGLLKSAWRIVTNPTMLFAYISYIAMSMYYSGFSAFGPKYMETQFDLNPSRTALLSAIVILPPGILGNLLGGVIVRYFGKTRRDIASIVLILSIAMVLLEPLALIFGCENDDIAGLTVNYDGNMGSDVLPNLNAVCNDGCGCENIYDPVCGSDGMTYAGACFAGCRDINYDNTTAEVFQDCSCVDSMSLGLKIGTDHHAVRGVCQDNPTCQFLVPYLIWSSVVMTIVLMSAIPSSLVQIRSVALPDRAMGMALGTILGQLLGYLPGPIIYGALVDSACIMFQSSCGETGNCILYDIELYRYWFIGLNNLLRFFGAVLGFLVYLSIRLGWDTKKETSIDNKDDIKEEKQPIKGKTSV